MNDPADFWAIDIGTSGIRLARLCKGKSGYGLRDYDEIDYHDDFASLSEERQQEIKLWTLERLLKQANVRKKKVVVSLNDQSVFTQRRFLPPIPLEKVESVIRYELIQQIPFGIEKVYYDYHIFEISETGGYDVMIFAVKKDVANKTLDILEAAECCVYGVSTDSVAVYNWLKHIGQLDDPKVATAIVNIGANVTQISIETNGRLAFMRPVNLGGDNFVRMLKENFSILWVSAEEEIRKYNVASQNFFAPLLTKLTDEIKRSFSYFHSLPGGSKVDRVLLIGGGSEMIGLGDYLKEQLLAEPNKLDIVSLSRIPYISMKESNGEFDCKPSMSVVLGLALSCQQEVAVDINLLPGRQSFGETIKKFKKSWKKFDKTL